MHSDNEESKRVLALRAANAAVTKSDTWFTRCRGGERVAAAFFIYLAVLACFQQVSPVKIVLMFAVPVVIIALGNLETIKGRRWTSYLRDWLASGLILIAYWEIDWLATGHYLTDTQNNWLVWDRVILYQLGLKQAVESMGPVGPVFLEFCYLLLYSIPLFCLLLIYLNKRRPLVDRFYRVFFLGALAAYALLPLIPIQSPRLFMPGQDLPIYSSVFRKINVYVLEHLDISTSVFPSGHVGVAFASFWGLYSVLPEKRALWGSVLAMALMVFTATIYGRYHYAADGLASVGITTVAWRLASYWGRDD